MFTEDDLLAISALQHLAFCERQWGLIHLEQQWIENRLTAEGRNLHERTHQLETESRGDIRIARGLAIRSLRLGLVGKADVVEFHRLTGRQEQQSDSEDIRPGISFEGLFGLWRPMPVEYKRGRPKIDRCDEIQLCAQVLCLEEMLNVAIEQGALFYGTPRRRKVVEIDADLRRETLDAIQRLHELTRTGITPSARYGKHCRSCSLVHVCMPRLTDGKKNIERYLKSVLDHGG